MPLVLDNPEQVTVTTVKITAFTLTVEPLWCQIAYQRGIDSPEGFVSIGSATATFNAEQIQAVDPDGTVYNSMKDALYELLETRVGPGTIE